MLLNLYTHPYNHHMGSISHHITSLVINSLGGGHILVQSSRFEEESVFKVLSSEDEVHIIATYIHSTLCIIQILLYSA